MLLNDLDPLARLRDIASEMKMHSQTITEQQKQLARERKQHAPRRHVVAQGTFLRGEREEGRHVEAEQRCRRVGHGLLQPDAIERESERGDAQQLARKVES